MIAVRKSPLERVRAKFVVHRIVRHRGSCRSDDGTYVGCEQQTVEASAIYSTSPEDNTFAQASPSGSLTLSITKSDVVDFFELDKPYYIDFSRAFDPDAVD